MGLGDYSSVVQLGVGLHVGTVLLQSIAEFASAPVVDRIKRLANLAALRRERIQKSGLDSTDAEIRENEVLDLQTSLELKRLQFFNEYRIAAIVNTIFALLLFGVLVWAAAQSDREVHWPLASLIVFVSFAPAVISLLTLWWRWHVNTEDIRDSLRIVEQNLLG